VILNRSITSGVLAVFAAAAAHAQFKEIKAAPFGPAVAHQKIRTLLENAAEANRDQTVATISDWAKWYRDIIDEELIARWKTDGRANLPLIMAPLADDRVAREVIEYSWRTDRPAAFTIAYAPMLGNLMERYPESAKPFLDDLLSAQPPELTQPEADAVCRILLDMPDIGTWKKSATLILPRYRAAADRLTKQDVDGPDQEKMYSALRWRAALNLDPPAVSARKPMTRVSRPAPAVPQSASDAYGQRPHLVLPAPAYTGPMSGIFESTGDPIPQNGEYVFPNVPPVHLLLDFDTKHWEARLAPGEGQTQTLILRNKGKGPQKKVVVRWTVQP
jgi:hypothetical protein